MLTQFVAAFDDTFVFRYNKEREAKERIDVRYVFGPKQRVMKDINDAAKTMTLPVVSIEQTNMVRDSSRVFNKNSAFFKKGLDVKSNTGYKIPTPVPINMDINVSIMAKFKEDIDQISQNFAAYFNPYIIISWKVPEEFGLDFIDEIRTEVQWSGSVDYETPNSLGSDDKFKIIGNTSFTIKGWVFPEYGNNSKPIYVVNAKLMAVDFQDKILYTDDYNSLSSFELETDTLLISAYPSITNIFYTTSGASIPILTDTVIRSNQVNNFTLFGKRFSYNNFWYLSGDVVSSMEYQLISSARFPLVSGYKIPEEYVLTVDDNIASITFPSQYLSGGGFTFITANGAGWVDGGVVFTVD